MPALNALLNRLTPRQAIWLCFILGYASFFLPNCIALVGAGSVPGAPPVLFIWGRGLPDGVVDHCSIINYVWLNQPPPDWWDNLQNSLANTLRILFLFPVVTYYHARFGNTPEALARFLFVALALALIPVFAMHYIISQTPRLFCDPWPTIYLSSQWPFLPTFLVWGTSLVLGLSATQRLPKNNLPN